MASPIDSLIETLTETRAKLEEQLGRNEAYRALRQLEQREASGEQLNIVSSHRLRQTIESELGSDSYFQACRKIDEALAMLGDWPAGGGGSAPPERASEVSAEAASAKPEQALEAPTAPQAVSVASEPADIAGAPLDDLSLIRDLPLACVSVVAAAGYGRYEALASIGSAGVGLLERLLGQRGIVGRGNWIEQAAILAQGRETRYAARLLALRTGAEWPPQPNTPEMIQAIAMTPPASMAVDVAPEAAAPTTPLPVEPPPERIDLRLAEPQDLTHVSGIDRTLAERLVEGGVTFARLAAWTAGDVRVAAQALDIAPSRIAAEGWIEQAALLSGGRVSHFLAGKSLRVPLALLPPPLDIPLDVEPEPIVEAAAEPVATAAKSAAESEAIVVPAAANDDRPPRSEEASESGPPVAPAIWPAAAAKAAILRPLRKPAERGDKAFDDVAALVAQTVATARNVGGMADRPARPASAPAAARAEPGPATEALRPQPAAKPAPPAAARVSPRSPAVTAPAPNIAPQPPRQERPMARMRTRGADPEASIEIRAHASAPAEVDTAALARSLGEALTPKPASPPSASTGRPPAERASQIAATLRQPASSVAAAPVRRMVVIDEIDNKWPMPAIDAPKPASPLLAARTSGLFSRLVKVLRGDAAD